jgi:hypothetical protein
LKFQKTRFFFSHLLLLSAGLGAVVRRVPLGVVPRVQRSYAASPDTFQVVGNQSAVAPLDPSRALNLLVLVGVAVGGSSPSPQALSLLLQVSYPDMAIFDCVGVLSRGLSFSPAGATDPIANHSLSHCVRAESLGRTGPNQPRYSEAEDSQYSCDDQGTAKLAIEGLGSRADPMPYRLCKVFSPYPSYNNTDGYLGLGNREAGQFPPVALPFLDTALNGTGSLMRDDGQMVDRVVVVVVRVDAPWAGPSGLVVAVGDGAFDLPELAGVAWSGPQPTRAATEHSFFLYDLSLCGVGLLANYSGGWRADISLALGCIGLPGAFFDMVKAHVRADCAPMVPSAGSSGGFTERCVLPLGTPPLTFRLHQDRAQQVHRLRLSGQCIQRHRASTTGLLAPPILLGAATLADMDLALDYAGRRVGLIPRPGRDIGTGNPSLCAAPPVCARGTTFYAPMNKCILEACTASGSGVTELYARSRRCEPSKAAQVLLGFAIAIFFLIELVLAESHHRFKENTIQQFPVCSALNAGL